MAWIVLGCTSLFGYRFIFFFFIFFKLRLFGALESCLVQISLSLPSPNSFPRSRSYTLASCLLFDNVKRQEKKEHINQGHDYEKYTSVRQCEVTVCAVSNLEIFETIGKIRTIRWKSFAVNWFAGGGWSGWYCSIATEPNIGWVEMLWPITTMTIAQGRKNNHNLYFILSNK